MHGCWASIPGWQLQVVFQVRKVNIRTNLSVWISSRRMRYLEKSSSFYGLMRIIANLKGRIHLSIWSRCQF